MYRGCCPGSHFYIIMIETTGNWLDIALELLKPKNWWVVNNMAHIETVYSVKSASASGHMQR